MKISNIQRLEDAKALYRLHLKGEVSYDDLMLFIDSEIENVETTSLPSVQQ